MSWSSLRSVFLDKLKAEDRVTWVSMGLFFPIQQISLNDKVIKGREFLSSINELRSLLYPTINEEFWKKFLCAAMRVMDNPSEENYIALYSYLSRLKKEIKENASLHSGWDVGALTYSLYTVAGGSLFIGGGMLLDCVIAGTCMLAMGPWGAAALAVGLMLLGIIIATYAGCRAYENFRMCRDSQLKEIEHFVHYLDPQPGTVRRVEPIDMLIYPDDESLPAAPGLG